MEWAPAPVARGLRGAVVSPHHLASDAGAQVLRSGGNAVDAAIATNAALAVVASNMCGIGGDAFWLVWDGATNREYALNGSGRSGEEATLEAARAAGLERMPVRGPWTVTVPGAVRSWADAHARFGRLDWAELFAPSIELASEGFPASERWSASVERSAVLFGSSSDWASVFRPNGRAWRPGERVVLGALGRTLTRIASDGAGELYEGEVAHRIAAYLAQRGARLGPSDLREHRSDWTEPISTTYRPVTATSHGPNSAGAIALELLNVLEVIEPRRDGGGRAVDAEWVHTALEASRLTLADRDSYLSDPDAMAPGSLERLLDKRHAAELAARIDPARADSARVSPLPAGGGTVYLATADAHGNLVSLIESNYAGFGSGLVDPETGIAFQNRGAFFTLNASDVNALAPRKRTMHTLAPGMLFRDGRPWIVHGSMGGEIQPQIFAQFVTAVVDAHMSIADAISAPRWAAEMEEHHGPPSLSMLESRIARETASDLSERGHRVEWAAAYDSGMGHAHAIELSEGGYVAATDPRSDGLPAVV